MRKKEWIWLAGCVVVALLVGGGLRMLPTGSAPEPGEARARVAPDATLPSSPPIEPPAAPPFAAPAARRDAIPSPKMEPEAVGVEGIDAPLAEPPAAPDWLRQRSFSERLQELGYGPDQIDRIRRAWDESKEDLENKLMAIGPGLTRFEEGQREQQSRQEVLDELLDDLGPEDTDAARYAAGDPNRLEVSWVPEQSLQNEAGLRSGDQVVSVGGESFTSRYEYLQWLGKQEQTGDFVPVEVLRDGELIVLGLPNGNLGPAVTEVSVRPD